MSEKILVVTGGGDCPGLNAVIRAITIRSYQKGYCVFGSRNAFHGILQNDIDLIELNPKKVLEILSVGGTILGTSNKGLPTQFPVEQDDGSIILEDKSYELIERIKSLGFTAVINIGGDGSQRISYDLSKKGLNIIGIPKTIDNDLAFTDFTFGYRTAVDIATDAVDKLVTTAKSHQRIMILEVMGRDAGWIALSSGIAGGADMILIPEIPFDIPYIIDRIRKQEWRDYSIIVIAEGAFPKDGKIIGKKDKSIAYENTRLGGVGHFLAKEIEPSLKRDVRVSVLGHLQRGGSPNALDRTIASEFGVKAVDLIEAQKFAVMTSYHYPNITDVPLEKAIKKNKHVDTDSFLFKTALGLNISFGIKLS